MVQVTPLASSGVSNGVTASMQASTLSRDVMQPDAAISTTMHPMAEVSFMLEQPANGLESAAATC